MKRVTKKGQNLKHEELKAVMRLIDIGIDQDRDFTYQFRYPINETEEKTVYISVTSITGKKPEQNDDWW